MLLSFGFKNYFSFKEGATVSFEFDAKVPSQISRGHSVGTVLCINGANASGKTNVLRALSFIKTFATRSFDVKPDELIPLEVHFECDEPAEFFAEFTAGEYTYLYELGLTDKEVVYERIYRTKAKRIKIIERRKGRITHTTKEFERLNSMKVRKNASVISTANQYEFKELSPIYRFFNRFASNVTYSGMQVEIDSEFEVAKVLSGNPEIFEFVKEFLRDADVGISDIEIIERKDPTKEESDFYPVFVHGEGKGRGITTYTESSGTRALFKNLARYRLVLMMGGVLIADEFDIHLHPHLLPKIVGLYLSQETNPERAQLIFTTHNSEIMDMLGRYRTYLVNKENNESFAYRLDEIPGDILRNDRLISPVYNEGKVGGVPKV